MKNFDIKSSLVLIGFKASGKTSVGFLLSQICKVPFIDTDRLLEKKYLNMTKQSLSCRQIYRILGEYKFRNLENEVVQELEPNKNTVIATGGGVVLDMENQRKLKDFGYIVYLYAAYDILIKRLVLEGVPAYIEKDLDGEFYSQFIYREPLYRQYADHIISTDQHTIPQLANQLGVFLGAYHGEQ